MKRGVARKVNVPTARAAERETTPQRLTAVAETARAEVQRGCGGDAKRLDRVFLPPIQLRDQTCATLADERSDPERHDPGRRWMRVGEPANRRVVQMVVVVVRQEDDVERRQFIERDAGRHPAA